MQVNSINNTTFGAKLDVKNYLLNNKCMLNKRCTSSMKCQTNKDCIYKAENRLVNIAKIFEEKTARDKKGLMDFTNYGHDFVIRAFPYSRTPNGEIDIDLPYKTKENLFKLSDAEIAEKLVELLNFSREASADKNKAIKFINNFSRKYKNVEDVDKNSRALYDLMMVTIESDATQKLSKNPFFKDCRVIL